MTPEAAFRSAMLVGRQDSLDDALQLIYRDQRNGQVLGASQPSPPRDSFYGHNDLNFEGSVGDVGDYESILTSNIPDVPMEGNFLDALQDLKKDAGE